ncbi:MAG: DUF2851 family protein [Dehalococcoidia bacterium]|nr:DUF2851 family protein [Dehalococcoidia bacterium]
MANTNRADRPKVAESFLAQIWKGQWVRKGPLPTSDGRMVRVRSPGMENHDSGPDFLGAAILFDDEIITGDIELHVKSSDWRAHGHHLDPHFNQVILHVVLWDDAKKATQLQSGKLIPTLSLRDYLNGSMDELSLRAQAHPAPPLPCRGVGDRCEPDKLGEILDRFGLERFYFKSAAFEVELILEEPAQVVYWGIMGALGYTKNKKPFQELARRLPVRVLESIALEPEPENRLVRLQALLLGASGLLPSQCQAKSGLGKLATLPELDEAWRSLNTAPSMSYADWHFSRMHPNNFPTQRLLAAGCLVDRHLEKGLFNSVIDLVGRAKPGREAKSIEDGFVVPAFIGHERAREIVVNAVLPFSFAWAEIGSQPKLSQHILAIYRAYPRIGENQITRYLSNLFWDNAKSRNINSAQRQQGMIHLYKTFCQEQRCEACEIPDCC